MPEAPHGMLLPCIVYNICSECSTAAVTASLTCHTAKYTARSAHAGCRAKQTYVHRILTCYCRVYIDARRCKVPDSSSGAVHLMFSMKRKEDVQRTSQNRVGPVACAAHRVKHEQKVLCIAQPLTWLRRPPPEPPAEEVSLISQAMASAHLLHHAIQDARTIQKSPKISKSLL